jgi:hypothetical protein
VTAPYVTQRDYTVELDEESNPTGTVWVELFINTFQALYIYNYLTNAWDEVWSQDLETHYHALAESSSNPTLPGTSAGYSVGGVPVQAPSTPPVLFTASADVVAGVSSISTQKRAQRYD